MANIKVVLMCRVKTEKGWRHYPAVYSANGKVKQGFVLVDGKEVKHPTEYYELRYYDGANALYEGLLGVSATEAEYRRKRKEAQLKVLTAAGQAGVEVVPVDAKGKLLKDELKRFLAAAIARGSVEAEEVYKLACDEFLEVIEKRYVSEIAPADLIKFHTALAARGMSKRTVVNRHNSVKAFLLFLGRDVKKLPKPPKPEKTMPEIYTDRELKDLFKAVKDPKLNLLYWFLLQTGAREREAMHVEWSDINTETGTIRFHSKPKWNFRMKDFEERYLRLPPELMEKLMTYKEDRAGRGTLIFPKDGKPDGHMLRTLKQQVRGAGLSCGQCDGCMLENPKRSRECDNWFLHKFRASFCTKLLRSNKLDIRTIQQMMGHGDLASTMRYIRPAENAQTQKVIDRMSWV